MHTLCNNSVMTQRIEYRNFRNLLDIEQEFGQQEEWERMGFHGELQGTGQNGQNGLDQDGDAPDEAGHANGPGMKRSR